MPSLQAATPVERQARFALFHAELAPVLVDFVDALGIAPADQVLRQAGEYVPYVELALSEMAIADADDRSWLLVRMVYFIGEYFAQQYGGSWYVNEMPGSPLFGRCVVGKFRTLSNSALMIDPLAIASSYVDLPCPRPLATLVAEVEAGLAGRAGQALH